VIRCENSGAGDGREIAESSCDDLASSSQAVCGCAYSSEERLVLPDTAAEDDEFRVGDCLEGEDQIGDPVCFLVQDRLNCFRSFCRAPE